MEAKKAAGANRVRKALDSVNGSSGQARAAAKDGAARGDVVLDLKRVQIEEMTVRVVGTAPLVVHRMGSKALQQIGEAQGLYAKTPKRPKDPVEAFLDTLFRPLASDAVVAVDAKGARVAKYVPDELIEGLHPIFAEFEDGTFNRFCFPAHAYREAMGSAAYTTGVTKDIVTVRRLVSVSRIMLPIESPTRPQMRFDVADVMGKPDLRFRAQFTDWAMTLVVRYATSIATAETVLNLLRLAGVIVGIGEMRPEKKVGTFGSFGIDPESVRVVRLEV